MSKAPKSLLPQADLQPFAPHLGPSLGPSPCVPPLSLYPLHPPPSSSPPSRPSRPDLPSPPAGYVRSVHACPAAYPRIYAGELSRSSYPYTPIPADEDKAARAKRIDIDKVLSATRAREAAGHELEGWELNLKAGAPGLWMSVERWRREEVVEGGVTIVMLHANGMLKEDYHPALRQLLTSPPPTAQFGTRAALPPTAAIVNNIYLLEDTMQGTSVDLNAGNLPAMHSWTDLARDLRNFLTHCMPEDGEEVGWALEWRAERPTRPVVGVGHSVGGNANVQAANASPELFESLFLIEPMTNPTGFNNSPATGFHVQGLTLKRRTHWPSRAQASAVMRPNPMFSQFPSSVFDIWTTHGILPTTSDPEGEVTLTTPTWSESACFSDCTAPQRGWDLLPQLKVPVGFVVAEDARWLGGNKIAREMVSRPPRSRHERTRAGHLAVQEAPEWIGESLGRHLATVRSGVWDNVDGKL